MRLLSVTQSPVAAGNENMLAAPKASVSDDAARLRALARVALERLGEVAQQILRRQPGGAPGMEDMLAEVSDRLETYCACVGCEVDAALEGRGGYAAVLSGHLHGFRARQRRTLRDLAEHVRRAPHSAGVAHGVVAASVVLVADLDGHARDLALVVGGSASEAA